MKVVIRKNEIKSAKQTKDIFSSINVELDIEDSFEIQIGDCEYEIVEMENGEFKLRACGLELYQLYVKPDVANVITIGAE